MMKVFFAKSWDGRFFVGEEMVFFGGFVENMFNWQVYG